RGRAPRRRRRVCRRSASPERPARDAGSRATGPGRPSRRGTIPRPARRPLTDRRAHRDPGPPRAMGADPSDRPERAMWLRPDEEPVEQLGEGPSLARAVGEEDGSHQRDGLADPVEGDGGEEVVDEMAVAGVPEEEWPRDESSPVE